MSLAAPVLDLLPVPLATELSKGRLHPGTEPEPPGPPTIPRDEEIACDRILTCETLFE